MWSSGLFENFTVISNIKHYTQKEKIVLRIFLQYISFILNYKTIFLIIMAIRPKLIKAKLEIDNNSATKFDTKFINIAEILTKSDSTIRFL